MLAGMPQRSCLSRRALLLAACSSSALAGCGQGAAQLLGGLAPPTALQVEIVGMPPAISASLAAALDRCASAYQSANRGRVALRVSHSLTPNPAWYAACSVPPQPPPCPGFAQPAAAPSVLQIAGLEELGQLGSSGIASLLISGRTRLNVQFGTAELRLPVPNPNPVSGTLPDIVIAYDLWQYWIAPLAVDLSGSWPLYPDDRAGLPDSIQRFGRFFTPQDGMRFAAYPLLRNPMLLLGTMPSLGQEPWDWSRLIRATVAYSAGIWTGGFLQDPLYPEATELAAAMVVAFGGQLASGGAQTVSAVFSQSAAVRALEDLSYIVLAVGSSRAKHNSVHTVRKGFCTRSICGTCLAGCAIRGVR